MFPIGRGSCAYDKEMVHKFDALAAEMGYSWTLEQILPQPVPAGTPAGILTPEGAALLDPSGNLQPGIPLAPCEGDAGTGMTATNAVRLGTGNVSAGTSDFAMLVTDCKMAVHREIDMVTTPAGIPVAMVHCNNCTSDINAWVSLFEEFAERPRSRESCIPCCSERHWRAARMAAGWSAAISIPESLFWA